MFLSVKVIHGFQLLLILLLIIGLVDSAALSPSEREKEKALGTINRFLRSKTGASWLSGLAQNKSGPLTTAQLMEKLILATKPGGKVHESAVILRKTLDTQQMKKDRNSDYLLDNWGDDLIKNIETEDDIICLYRKDSESSMRKADDWKKFLKSISVGYTIHLALDKGKKYVVCLKKTKIDETQSGNSILETTTISKESITTETTNTEIFGDSNNSKEDETTTGFITSTETSVTGKSDEFKSEVKLPQTRKSRFGPCIDDIKEDKSNEDSKIGGGGGGGGEKEKEEGKEEESRSKCSKENSEDSSSDYKDMNLSRDIGKYKIDSEKKEEGSEEDNDENEEKSNTHHRHQKIDHTIENSVEEDIKRKSKHSQCNRPIIVVMPNPDGSPASTNNWVSFDPQTSAMSSPQPLNQVLSSIMYNTQPKARLEKFKFPFEKRFLVNYKKNQKSKFDLPPSYKNLLLRSRNIVPRNNNPVVDNQKINPNFLETFKFPRFLRPYYQYPQTLMTYLQPYFPSQKKMRLKLKPLKNNLKLLNKNLQSNELPSEGTFDNAQLNSGHENYPYWPLQWMSYFLPREESLSSPTQIKMPRSSPKINSNKRIQCLPGYSPYFIKNSQLPRCIPNRYLKVPLSTENEKQIYKNPNPARIQNSVPTANLMYSMNLEGLQNRGMTIPYQQYISNKNGENQQLVPHKNVENQQLMPDWNIPIQQRNPNWPISTNEQFIPNRFILNSQYLPYEMTSEEKSNPNKVIIPKRVNEFTLNNITLPSNLLLKNRVISQDLLNSQLPSKNISPKCPTLCEKPIELRISIEGNVEKPVKIGIASDSRTWINIVDEDRGDSRRMLDAKNHGLEEVKKKGEKEEERIKVRKQGKNEMKGKAKKESGIEKEDENRENNESSLENFSDELRIQKRDNNGKNDTSIGSDTSTPNNNEDEGNKRTEDKVKFKENETRAAEYKENKGEEGQVESRILPEITTIHSDLEQTEMTITNTTDKV